MPPPDDLIRLTPAIPRVERFAGLDVLRGIAAIGVVFWHWQHFFAGAAPPYDITRAPLADALAVFYRHGWLAVDLFFCLSGFIFFRLYATRVSNGEIGAGRFALLRFSRLYPLHLLTLLLVAAGQGWLARAGLPAYVYENNDVRHFVLNLAFAPSWGLENGYSFNGPAWSISVEIFLYAAFFVFCRHVPVRLATVVVAALLGFAFAAVAYPPIGRGIGAFFVGGLTWMVYERLEASAQRAIVLRAIVAAAVLSWCATLVLVSGATPIPAPVMTGAFRHAPKAWAVLWLFPVTILALASVERKLPEAVRRAAALGDISYSVYLLHFPLQLAVYIFHGRLHADSSIYYSLPLAAAFLAVLLALATLSYRAFEMPLQQWLRGARGRAALPTNAIESPPARISRH